MSHVAPRGAVTVAPSIVVSTPRPANAALSPDGLTIYTTSSDGNVRAFNAETGALISRWDVGNDLGALDVSPDGRFLIAVENQPLATHPGSYWWEDETTVTVYRVDLATGHSTTIPYVAKGLDYTFLDVAVLSNGDVLLTQKFQGSGWTLMKLLDPNSGRYTEIDEVRGDTVLTRTSDGSKVLLAEGGGNDGYRRIYDIDEGIAATTSGGSPQAISGERGLVVDSSPGVLVRDISLELIIDLGKKFPQFSEGYFDFGFDETGEFLFILSHPYLYPSPSTIVQISTRTWKIVQTVPVDVPTLYLANLETGSDLIVGPDMRFFMVVTANGLQRIDNPAVTDALAGTSGSDAITGTHDSDTLIGYGGNDVLNGHQGADTMIGGTGHDTYIVDHPDDVVVELGGGGTDIVQSSVSYRLPTHVERLVLTGSGNIGGTGNGGDNVLTGNGGNNRLDGRAGADRMEGGNGNDTYVVDNVGDLVIELAGKGTDTVLSSIDYTLGANVERLTLTGRALNGTGNDLANILISNGFDNILNGGTGNDRMEGGKGDDLYFIDSASDRIVELAGQGTDTAMSRVSYTLSDHVEHLTLYGGAAINGTGNGLANTITGNDAANRIDGGVGADRMIGGKGHDIYIVDNVGDVVVEAGQGGTDSVYSSIDFRLPVHVERLFLTGSASVDGFGNSGDNIVTGNNGNNTLNGGSGSDRVDGGAGNDRIYGHTGNDDLIGGAGSDLFVFNTALGPTNIDDILDFFVPNDTIYLARSIFTKAGANGTMSASAFHKGTAAADAADRIVYHQANGNIFYDPDGTGAAAPILFATVTDGTALTSADFVIYS